MLASRPPATSSSSSTATPLPILYELLTGLRPIDAKRLKKAALAEMIRIIQEDERSKPSTRLSTAESLPSLAAMRQTESRQLMALLRKELDWIVMKCLDKQRERRYDTANGLMRDLQRYLADEPVEARPPSAGYRLGKILRRNRGQVSAIGLVLLALLGGIIGTALGLVEARKQTRVAVAEALAREEARQNEAEQRNLAEQANKQAYEALKSFTDELMGKLLGGKDQLTDTDKATLRNAQKQWEVFAQSKGNSAEASAIRSEGAAELALLHYKLGMNAEAEANDRVALMLRASLATDFPEVPLYRLKHGISHHNLAANLRGTGSRAEAETHFQKAAEVFAALAADFPEKAAYRQRLAKSYVGLANVKRAKSNWAEAEKLYRDALVLQKQLADKFPSSADYRNEQARSHWGLAFTLMRAGRLPEAEVEYRQALALTEKLADDFPGELGYRQQSANLARELGVFLYDNEQDEAGARLFPKAIAVLEKLTVEFPSIPVYRFGLSRCRRDYGKVLGFLKKPIEAEEQFRKAITLGEKLVNDHATMLPNQAELGLSYSYFADMLTAGETPARSLEWYRKAISTLTAAYLQDRQVFLTRNALAKCHAALAETYGRLGKHSEAVQEWDKALELARPTRSRSFRAYGLIPGRMWVELPKPSPN